MGTCIPNLSPGTSVLVKFRITILTVMERKGQPVGQAEEAALPGKSHLLDKRRSVKLWTRETGIEAPAYKQIDVTLELP